MNSQKIYKQPIIEFLTENKINWFPINLSINVKDKKLEYSESYKAMPKQTDFKNIPDESIILVLISIS